MGKQIRTPLCHHHEVAVWIVKRISSGISRAIEFAMSRPGMLTILSDQDNADMSEKTPGAFGIFTLTQIIAEKRRLKVLS